MKISSVELKNVGGIPYLKIENINPQMNIICGENGVGKTNILNAIAACFSEFDRSIISKKADSESGKIVIKHDVVGINDFVLEIEDFKPSASEKYLKNRSYKDNYLNLLYLKTNRGIEYKKVLSINSDPSMQIRARNSTSGVDNSDIKDWLLNRVLHSKHNGHLSETQIKNLNSAKKCFGIFNPEFEYSRLDTANDIFLKTPTGEIYFEYLSSGFKSTIFILLGIIKEIDYRFEGNRIAAFDYNGIILIDEVELHLHPEWQGRICAALKETFPRAQFFISTHSPHVVQTAGQNEVITLERKEAQVIKRDLPDSEYGYQGWTIEEILEDVMGMPDLRTQKYNDIKKRFDDALDNQNKEEARAAFDELDKMLHPRYPLRQVFKMQLDSLGE